MAARVDLPSMPQFDPHVDYNTAGNSGLNDFTFIFEREKSPIKHNNEPFFSTWQHGWAPSTTEQYLKR